MGSAQSRSHNRPCEPGSWKRSIVKISLRVTSSGEIPPCTQKKRPSTKAATGKDQKERMQASYTFSEYLCRPREEIDSHQPWRGHKDNRSTNIRV